MMLMKHKNRRRTLLVAIDGIDVLENLEPATFLYLIEFFRALCDEMSGGDLGNVITFKYILVHPGFSDLLHKPHPREQIVICTWTSGSGVSAADVAQRGASVKK